MADNPLSYGPAPMPPPQFLLITSLLLIGELIAIVLITDAPTLHDNKTWQQNCHKILIWLLLSLVFFPLRGNEDTRCPVTLE